MLLKTDTRLKVLDMIKQLVEAQARREAMLATPAGDDMIYSVPKCLCITMVDGKPASTGAMHAPAMPGGLSFQNGAGTKAVWKRRHLVLREEMVDAEACIAMLARELTGKKE